MYLRTQAAILRSFGVSTRGTAKLFQKSRSLVAKWSSSQESHDKPRSGRPTVLDRLAKKIKEKAKYKKGSSIKKNQQTTEEQRSAWNNNNRVEIYVQKRMQTLREKKKTTTSEQQTAETSLSIRSQITLQQLQEMNGKSFSLAISALIPFPSPQPYKRYGMRRTGKPGFAIVPS